MILLPVSQVAQMTGHHTHSLFGRDLSWQHCSPVSNKQVRVSDTTQNPLQWAICSWSLCAVSTSPGKSLWKDGGRAGSVPPPVSNKTKPGFVPQIGHGPNSPFQVFRPLFQQVSPSCPAPSALVQPHPGKRSWLISIDRLNDTLPISPCTALPCSNATRSPGACESP